MGVSTCRLFCNRRVAAANLLLAPFLLVFLLIYFFMRNAEKFYHQPSSAGARRWSSLAAWRLREFNELPHYLNHRSPAFPSNPDNIWETLAHAVELNVEDWGGVDLSSWLVSQAMVLQRVYFVCRCV